MKYFTLLVVFVVALAIVTTASAHRTDWYWNAAKAEYKLMNTGQALSAFNAHEITSADCVGLGTRKWIDWIPSNRNPRVRLYRHFECFVTWIDYDGQGWEVERKLHVRGSHRYSMTAY